MTSRDTILNTVLKDDAKSTGGKSHANETVSEFMDEAGLHQDSPLDELNDALAFCGVKPLIYEHYPELFTHDSDDVVRAFQKSYEYIDDFIHVKCNKYHNDEDDDNTFVEDVLLENLFRNVFVECLSLEPLNIVFSNMYLNDNDEVIINFIDFDNEDCLRYRYAYKSNIKEWLSCHITTNLIKNYRNNL